MRFAGKFCALSSIAALLSFAPAAHAQPKPKDAECLACHADAVPSTAGAQTGPAGMHTNPAVDAATMKGSAHGSFACVDCHKDVKTAPHSKTPAKVSCAECHADAARAYAHGYHATAKKPDGSPLATCTDCHGNAHAILPAGDPRSKVAHVNIPATCGACHGQKFVMGATGVSTQPFISYQQSVHGRAVANGSDEAAVCTDCHGAHDILPANDAKSLINKFNVPATCGRCHAGVQMQYTQSIHGQAIARGNNLAPVCTDCHGIHTIKTINGAPGSAASNNQSLTRDSCAGCHQGVRLTQEFGVAGNRVSSYLDSYHGLAAQGGSVVAANCSSCHGVHNILPSSDPRSTINPANLDATCGQCHKGVTQKFTRAKVHVDIHGDGHGADLGSVVVRWVRWIYIPLIVLVIGGMFLHNALIWRAKTLARRRLLARTVVRMTPNQRWQHLILLSSFFVLVVTGFALRFPESWFSSLLASLLGLSEHWRSLIHRIAGVVLIADGVYHLFYIAFTAEGRRLIRDFFPTFKDVTDALHTMLYYTGFRKEKPKYARFNYAEKAEYWALVWGTGLMAVTGIMLWAKVSVGNALARWWIDAATAVHFYEAILATLAILVWHFYQVFFDPDVYPMNWAWRDGSMSAEHYAHEHELDAATLAQAESSASEDARTTPPGTPPKE